MGNMLSAAAGCRWASRSRRPRPRSDARARTLARSPAGPTLATCGRRSAPAQARTLAAPMLVHLVDGTYELFRHFHGLRRFTARGSAVRRRRGRAADGAADVRAGRDAPRRRHRPRHRVVPQRPLARLQDRGRHRAGAARAVPSARGRARGDGRRRLADGRARGRRRARLGGPHRRAPTGASRRSASGRPTRTSRNACAGTASCRSIRRAQDDPRRRRRARASSASSRR